MRIPNDTHTRTHTHTHIHIHTWSFVFLFSSSVSFICIALIFILYCLSLNPLLNTNESLSSTSLPLGSLVRTRTYTHAHTRAHTCTSNPPLAMEDTHTHTHIHARATRPSKCRGMCTHMHTVYPRAHITARLLAPRTLPHARDCSVRFNSLGSIPVAFLMSCGAQMAHTHTPTRTHQTRRLELQYVSVFARVCFPVCVSGRFLLVCTSAFCVYVWLRVSACVRVW